MPNTLSHASAVCRSAQETKIHRQYRTNFFNQLIDGFSYPHHNDNVWSIRLDSESRDRYR
ncbi:MAG: hypothetical protein CMJ68_11965 [Planctomycetaceae bacterium]|nr:hypothetical protein [Planctomycetaceae bacterium]